MNGPSSPPSSDHRGSVVKFAASTKPGAAKMMRRSTRPPGLTTYNSILAGGDKEKRILLQKKDQSYRIMMNIVLREQQQHKLTSLHYHALNNWVLFVPAITLTLFSAILSLFATSSLLPDDNSKVWLAMIVAILQLFLALFQSVTKQLNYSAKGSYHEQTATALRRIYDDTLYANQQNRYSSIFRALKNDSRLSLGANLAEELSGLRKNIEINEDEMDASMEDDENPKEGVPEDELDDGEDGTSTEDGSHGKEKSIENVSKQLHDTVSGGDSVIPIKISLAYNMMYNRINVINKSLLTGRTASLVALDRVEPALYLQLTETIVQSKIWPIFIPDPSWAVNKAFRDFKEILRVDAGNEADLITQIIERADHVEILNQNILEKKQLLHDSTHDSTTDTLSSIL